MAGLVYGSGGGAGRGTRQKNGESLVATVVESHAESLVNVAYPSISFRNRCQRVEHMVPVFTKYFDGGRTSCLSES